MLGCDPFVRCRKGSRRRAAAGGVSEWVAGMQDLLYTCGCVDFGNEILLVLLFWCVSVGI